MVTGEDNVAHKGMHLHVRMMLPIFVEVLAGNTEVNHENVTGGPLLPFLSRWHILEGSDLPAGLFDLLKALQFLTAPGKFT